MYRLVIFLYLLAIAFGVYIPKGMCPWNLEPYLPSGKIVGGVETPIEDVPYQVAIEYNGHLFCGGSIIRTRHILCASHCFHLQYEKVMQKIYTVHLAYSEPILTGPLSLNVSLLAVRTGSSKRQKGDTVMKVKSYKLHPKYDKVCTDYDVAVIELEEDIQLNARSAIITLADTEPVSGDVLVSGWGQGPENREMLQSVVIPIVNRTAYEEMYNDSCPRCFSARMICAGGAGKSPWPGDSGGPLVAGKKDMRTQVGITSWAGSSSDYKYPAVFTNVAHSEIRSFIKEQAGV